MKESTKFKLLTVFRYIGDALYSPFLASYLKTTGLVEDSIGNILSIAPIIGILVNPIYTKLCPTMKKTKKVLSIVVIIEALLVMLIGNVSNYYLLMIIVGGIALFNSSHFSLLEGLTAQYANSVDLNYSGFRIFGSIAYIVGTALAGGIIAVSSYKICFIIGGCMSLISSFLYTSIKSIDEKERDEKEKIEIKSLFENKGFIIFFIYFVILRSAITASENFFPLFLESKGVNSTIYGYTYSFIVVFEVISLFLLMKFKSKRMSYHLMHIICPLLYFIRSFIYIFDIGAPIAIIVSCLRGIGYGFFLQSSFAYLPSIMKQNQVITAVMFMSLISNIVVFFLDNIFGTLIEKSGYPIFNIIVTSLYAVALIIALINKLKKQKQVAV